jgi:deoxyribose-phosphate aldolase
VTREELQRLIDIIVQEISSATIRPPARCECHSVLDDCCPDRLRGVIDAGATRVGVHATGGAPADVASMIDHTLLKPDATRQQIEELCREASQFKFATVCVNPTWVATSARLLAGTGVGVCSVVGFPLGATTADVKGYETQRAIFAAGGVRDLEAMKAMIAAGATRVGASAGVKIVQQARGEKSSLTTPSGY